jgi:hypothetical protein
VGKEERHSRGPQVERRTPQMCCHENIQVIIIIRSYSSPNEATLTGHPSPGLETDHSPPLRRTLVEAALVEGLLSPPRDILRALLLLLSDVLVGSSPESRGSGDCKVLHWARYNTVACVSSGDNVATVDSAPTPTSPHASHPDVTETQSSQPAPSARTLSRRSLPPSRPHRARSGTVD